jgi:hypothetical protein
MYSVLNLKRFFLILLCAFPSSRGLAARLQLKGEQLNRSQKLYKLPATKLLARNIADHCSCTPYLNITVDANLRA